MAEWTRVAELTDVSRRRKKLVALGEERVALFYAEGEVFAFRDACVHKGKSLARGTVLHGRVVCPGHQWAFDLRTGQADDREECQPRYEVRVADGGVWLRPAALAAAAAPAPAAAAAPGRVPAAAPASVTAGAADSAPPSATPPSVPYPASPTAATQE
ncbi:Rieske (2Fe-2S) protein [Streptomyces sp. NPDC004134]|uniref:Rieske (2Fe-2S) protein n=1 Tax=Streptomyces sp. NPDC004134 TaxID=3364691 RepID=UPI003689CF0C